MTEGFRQEQFLEVLDRDQAERRFHAALDLTPLEAELVSLSAALGRVLAEDVAAPLDVPGFDRANVDGFAVQSADTYPASETRPVHLCLNEEILRTGVVPRVAVKPGMATAIATGGMLPRGADAVIMVEYTDLLISTDSGSAPPSERSRPQLLVSRPVPPGANVTFAGTDIGLGEVVLRRAEVLTSRETGVLAALGLGQIAVVRRPRVAILSTGDELRPPQIQFGSSGLGATGCVFDSNSTVLCDAVRELGGEAIAMGIVPDDESLLYQAVQNALTQADMVLLSGGTSKGAGDVSYRIVSQLATIVAHGVALKPGKPLCLAVARSQVSCSSNPGRPIPVAVLPGFPTSAIFTFHEFLAPVLTKLAGRSSRSSTVLRADLPLRINSERGRTEYLLVGLVSKAGTPPSGSATTASETTSWTAYPMGKGSGSVTAFSRADGFLVIPKHQEYLEQGTTVEVHRLAEQLEPADLVVIGSHCIGIDFLLGKLAEQGVRSKLLAVGSMAGLEAARRGECDLAGVHLLDPVSNTYNRPFLTSGLELIQGYGRLQGLVFRPDDTRFVGRQLSEILEMALSDKTCVLANRNRGSGTRVLLDQLLGSVQPPGYLAEARSHNAVAAAIVQRRADWGVTLAPVARDYGLSFLPLRAEHYDFVVPQARRTRPALVAFLNLLSTPLIRQELSARGFDMEIERVTDSQEIVPKD